MQVVLGSWPYRFSFAVADLSNPFFESHWASDKTVKRHMESTKMKTHYFHNKSQKQNFEKPQQMIETTKGEATHINSPKTAANVFEQYKLQKQKHAKTKATKQNIKNKTNQPTEQKSTNKSSSLTSARTLRSASPQQQLFGEPRKRIHAPSIAIQRLRRPVGQWRSQRQATAKKRCLPFVWVKSMGGFGFVVRWVWFLFCFCFVAFGWLVWVMGCFLCLVF